MANKPDYEVIPFGYGNLMCSTFFSIFQLGKRF